MKKYTREIDGNDVLVNRTVYVWDEWSGWVGLQKYGYSYGNSGELITITHSLWNKSKNRWEEQETIKY